MERERQGLLCDSQSVLIGQVVDRSRLRNVCWIHVKLVMPLAEFSSPMATFRVNSSHLGAGSGMPKLPRSLGSEGKGQSEPGHARWNLFKAPKSSGLDLQRFPLMHCLGLDPPQLIGWSRCASRLRRLEGQRWSLWMQEQLRQNKGLWTWFGRVASSSCLRWTLSLLFTDVQIFLHA